MVSHRELILNDRVQLNQFNEIGGGPTDVFSLMLSLTGRAPFRLRPT